MPAGLNQGVPSSRGKGRGGRSSGGGRGRGARRGRGRGGRFAAGRGTVLPSAFRADREARADGGGGRHGKSRRGHESTGYEFEDDGDDERHRHKYDDEAGASDDGPDPEDSDFEDEEVDEDEAFDSADEAKYGEVMETILGRRTEKQGGDDDVEDADDQEEDEDGEDGGGVSLMDMLNANEAAAVAAATGGGELGAARGNSSTLSIGGAKGKGKRSDRARTGIPGKDDRTAGDSSDASADSADDVDAGDGASEEAKSEVGEFFGGDEDVSAEGEVDDDEEEEEDEDDEEDEDSDGGEGRHERLMDFVGSLGEKAAAAERAEEERRALQMLDEGEFNAPAIARAGDSTGPVSGKGGVTMEALMGSLQNSKGFAAVKKQVAALAGKSAAAPSAPVHRIAELRAEREAAYADRKEEMSKWVAPVQANRQAETLDFTQSVKMNLSNASLASKLEATTDLEREVEMLLTAGGASEAGLAEKEMEELQAKAYTVEEVKERQAELSKMRALMFYQERKQHHMNKIKSKVYRKIKKRRRERVGEAETGDDGDQAEAAARKRAEERMTLRHKNTTKWVKKALRAKGGAGRDDRKAISEQLQLGQELRAKMDNAGGGSSSGEESSSDDDDGERRPALKESDKRELEGIGGEDGNRDVSGKGASLLKMAFMQRAMDKQRARAKEESTALLRELEEASAAAAAAAEEEVDSEDADTRVTDKYKKRKPGRSPRKRDCDDQASELASFSKEERAWAMREIDKAFPGATLQSSAVGMDPRARSSVSAPITINLGGGEGGGRGPDPVSAFAPGEEIGAEVQPPSGSRNGVGGGEGPEVAKTEAVGVRDDESDDGEEEGVDQGNPWLAPTPRRSRERRRGRAGAANGKVLLDVKKAATAALYAFEGGPSEADKDSGVDVKGEKGGEHADEHPEVAVTGSNRGDEGDGVGSVGVRDEEGGTKQKEKQKAREDSKKKMRVGGESRRTGDEGKENLRATAKARVEVAGSNDDGGKGDQLVVGESKKSGNISKQLKKKKGNKKKDIDDKSEGTNGQESAAAASVATDGDEERQENHKPTRKKRKKRKRGDAAEERTGGGADGKGAIPGGKPRRGERAGGEAGADGTSTTGGGEKDSRGKKAKPALDFETGGGAASASQGGRLADLSNEELVRRAFAAPDFEAEFKESKDEEIEAEVATVKGREKLPKALAGWGSWTGEGAPTPRRPSKRQVMAEETQKKKEEEVKKSRKDNRLAKVVISEKRQKRSAKYMVAEVPYPFTSREQYERSLRQPIGEEWNSSLSVRDMTRPAVVVQPGAAVAPMKLGKLQRKTGEQQAMAPAKGRAGKKTAGCSTSGKGPGKRRSKQ